MKHLSEIRKRRLPRYSLLMVLAFITLIALSTLFWKRNHTDAVYEVVLAFDRPYSVETSYQSNTKSVEGRVRVTNVSKDKVSISYAGNSWVDDPRKVIQLIDRSASDIQDSARKKGINSSVLSTTSTKGIARRLNESSR